MVVRPYINVRCRIPNYSEITILLKKEVEKQINHHMSVVIAYPQNSNLIDVDALVSRKSVAVCGCGSVILRNHFPNGKGI